MDKATRNRGENSAYGRTIKYLGVFGGAHGFSLIFNMLRTKISSVLLGVAGQSIIALSNRTVQMFSDGTGLSLAFSAVRKISDTYENSDKESVLRCIKVVRSIAFVTGLLGMLLMLVTSPFFCDWIFESSSDYYRERIMALSPVVLFMAVSNGEIAILRGTMRLNNVAIYTFLSAIISFAVAVPAYFFIGIGGVFPAIILTAFLQMCLLLKFTLPNYSYRIAPFRIAVWREGFDMIKLGAGYVFASVFTSLSMWLVCALLSDVGDGKTVGLFSAGFVMATLLPGMLFAALDSEYYPRLSASAAKNDVCNRMVNEQIEVQLLVQPPMLMLFVLIMPILVPVFYKTDFLPAVPMAQMAMLGMFVRTISFPLSFLSLAKNDTLTYVLMEAVYNILFVVLIVVGYVYEGLFGVGAGIALLHTLDFIMIYTVARFRYGLRLSGNVVRYFILQLPIFLAIIAVSCFCNDELLYWLSGGACVLLSLAVVLYMFCKLSIMPKTVSRVLGKIKNVFKKRL